MRGFTEEMPTELNREERVEFEEEKKKGFLTRIKEYKSGFREEQEREQQVLSSSLWRRRGIHRGVRWVRPTF